MVEFDATILIQAFNFVFLLAILNLIFFQPIIRIQNERREAVDSARKSADSRMHELKTMREGYQQKLDSARQEAFELVSSKVAAATQEREAQMSKISAEMDARMNEAREQITAQENSLRDALGKEVSVLADAIFTRLTSLETKHEASIGS